MINGVEDRIFVGIDFEKIKQKFENIDPSRYWGDDFDVRFFLISNIKRLKNRKILDVGGGIGIISSELDDSNLIINLDLSLNDLRVCKNNSKSSFENICASMEFIPFKENVFDNVLCAHALPVTGSKELHEKLKNNCYTKVENTLKEIFQCMKPKALLFLTTPSSSYYESVKLSYDELKNILEKYFSKNRISFYNTYPKLSKKYRKMNLTNIIPKLKLKIMDFNTIIRSLIKENKEHEMECISFYVEAEK